MTGMFGGDRPGEGYAARRIDEAHDISAHAVSNAFDGIHRQALQSSGCSPFGFAGLAAAPDGPGAAPGVDAGGAVAHPVGAARDDTTDSGDRGPCEAVPLAPWGKQYMQLLLAQIGVEGAQAPDLGH